MFRGQLVAIYVGACKAGPLAAVAQVRAVAGCGLEGDRYASAAGTFTPVTGPDPDHEVTLIESEALAGMRREYQIELSPGEARRNLVTQGVPLNHLVGREFQVGEARLRGIRPCEPCKHLERLTTPGVRAALVHRGGLRAQVVSGGIIRTGDLIEPVGP